MYGFEHFGGGWYWPAVVSSAVFWAIVAVAVVALVRYLTRRGRPWPGPAPHTAQPGPYQPPAPPAMTSPTAILAERFARGEIDDQEYRHRLATLQGAAPGGAAGSGTGPAAS